MTQFGALLLPSLGWAGLAQRAIALEQAGFDAVYIDDHIAHPAEPRGPWLECWAALGGLAVSTDSIRFGPLVSNIVLRHPAMMARQAQTVAEMGDGRLDVGIGAGYDIADHAAVGRRIWSPQERAAEFASAVALVRERVADAATLTVAGHGPRAIRLAARYGDNWVSYGGFGITAAEAHALTRRRVAVLEDALVGHDVGRRLLCGSAALTPEPIWESLDAFDDFIGRYEAIGITEFAFHWPPENTNPRVDERVVGLVLERVAATSRRAGVVGDRHAPAPQPTRGAELSS